VKQPTGGVLAGHQRYAHITAPQERAAPGGAAVRAQRLNVGADTSASLKWSGL
jgi:hypothetical protein